MLQILTLLLTSVMTSIVGISECHIEKNSIPACNYVDVSEVDVLSDRGENQYETTVLSDEIFNLKSGQLRREVFTKTVERQNFFIENANYRYVKARLTNVYYNKVNLPTGCVFVEASFRYNVETGETKCLGVINDKNMQDQLKMELRTQIYNNIDKSAQVYEKMSVDLGLFNKDSNEYKIICNSDGEVSYERG